MTASNAQLLQQEAQSLDPSAVIHLFTLDASNVGGAVHRFCTEREADGTPVTFGGNQFPQISVRTEGFEWNSDGTLPRPKMSASALNATFYSLIVLTNGAQGALLLRERTLAKFLDGHEYGGRGIKFSTDLYIVDADEKHRHAGADHAARPAAMRTASTRRFARYVPVGVPLPQRQFVGVRPDRQRLPVHGKRML